VLLTEPYPLGAAIRRSATVTLQVDVDEHGIPTNFQALTASAELWGDDAIAVVR
jgi:hypothetical protein